MTTLSVSLPDTLAKASQEAARKKGISHTEFIRQAVLHELKHFQETLEEKAMVKSIMAMKKFSLYLKEADDIIEEWSTHLPEDENEWWHK